MKLSSGARLFAAYGTAVVAVWLGAGRAASQDPSLEPTYGWVKLRSGFVSDPFAVEVDSGGKIKTNLGDVPTFVDKAPDFRVKYNAGTGQLPLTFRVKCKADTTLLINTPDGKWIANDDGDGDLNPRITIRNPMSGVYDIWVGSYKGTVDPATLIVTELK